MLADEEDDGGWDAAYAASNAAASASEPQETLGSEPQPRQGQGISAQDAAQPVAGADDEAELDPADAEAEWKKRKRQNKSKAAVCAASRPFERLVPWRPDVELLVVFVK